MSVPVALARPRSVCARTARNSLLATFRYGACTFRRSMSGHRALRRHIGACCALLALSALACSQSGTALPPIYVAENAGAVVSIAVSPLTLTPAFSTSIDDYYVRCASGGNAITVSVTDGTGMQDYPLVVVNDQAVVVGDQYWIRCLPPDFPAITVTAHSGTPTPGYYLVDSATFAVVLDTNGTPVWYERDSAPMNLDSPATDTISFMPNSTSPFGTSAASSFEVLSLDTWATADIVAVGSPTDGHELQALPNGDHLLFTYPIESGFDLSGLQSFSSSETIADCEIQEIAPSGALVWSWLASDHVDPVESLEPSTATVNGVSVVDLFHCNSIDVDANGNLLVSIRYANAVYYVDRSTSQIQWKLGGTAHNKDGAACVQVQGDPETTFSMQHDARFQANGDVSMFDDHGAGPGVARGVEYALDLDANTATVRWQFLGTAQSLYEGSFRRYSDGESVIGWGYIPTDPRVVTELDADGNDVLDIAFAGANQSYRAVKVPLSQFDIGVLRATAAQ
jgi:hypothetical protein